MITHGTATLEETAYFLNIAVHDDVTVVVVGAQRPASGLSSDAGMNLVSAVRVAAAPEARGLGALVVPHMPSYRPQAPLHDEAGGECQPRAHARKPRTWSPGARSPSCSPRSSAASGWGRAICAAAWPAPPWWPPESPASRAR